MTRHSRGEMSDDTHQSSSKSSWGSRQYTFSICACDQTYDFELAVRWDPSGLHGTQIHAENLTLGILVRELNGPYSRA